MYPELINEWQFWHEDSGEGELMLRTYGSPVIESSLHRNLTVRTGQCAG